LGSSAPFSIGWLAVSDGSFGFAKDALIMFHEWYGWTGKPNTGLKMSANMVAQGVKVRDKDLGGKITYGVADPSIFATNGGPSIAEMMIVEGCSWIRGDNARQPGWEQIRKRLSAGTTAQDTLLLFHESCEQTIRTLPYLQHAEKNPEDLDCWVGETLVMTAEGEKRIDALTLQDRILTPLGACGILRLYLSGTGKTVILTLSDGRTLEGTPEHKIHIQGKGLVPLCEIQPGDYPTEPPKWLTSSNTMEKLIGVTLVNATISPVEGVRAFIDKCGQTFMALSHQIMTYTIKMKMLIITQSTILKPCPQATIAANTWSNASRVSWVNSSRTGAILQKVKRLSGKTPIKCSPTRPNGHWRASIVQKLSQQNILSSFFASNIAWNKKTSPLSLLVQYVQNRLQRNVALKSKPKPVHISAVGNSVEEKAVYNLTVDRAHLFYANQLLSSNTDAEDHAADSLRYGIMSRPITRFEKKLPEQGIRQDARALPTINELIARQAKKNHAAHTRY